MLKPGDIVLTSDSGKTSRLVRKATSGAVSHAMVCVQNGSVIDSTDFGVQAHNIQRELYNDADLLLVYRLRDPIDALHMTAVIELARSEIGTRYSKLEAARSILPGPKPRDRKMFCSRLVARAYAYAGVRLVTDPDYCTPDDLRNSPLLVPVADMSESVSERELAAWRRRPNPIAAMQESQNAVLTAARQLDPAVENFNDLDAMVQAHPEWDADIARAYRESGYLEIWKSDFVINPWHYDPDAMEEAGKGAVQGDSLHSYCVSTIREAQSGGFRYAVNLTHYRAAFDTSKRETTGQLVALYERLVWNDQMRRETALTWLRRHFPEDAKNELERILPHSQLWFSMVDRVEPRLGAIARLSIQSLGSDEICSSCGEPADDYRLVNGAEAMPGVPSLRLCSDCLGIRRGGGEVLEPFDD
ncbi:hypothetical protein M2341_001315 [Sphingobium sp. B7D2B]|uniref:YiiX/YebB-like N1pC/P60 family cysteine hydrolase n=1 Tax=Sphingobium sp. B7D2B TaxID=2940583 RepID=UPI0022249868|nr:YiiX/YebB-like N1pC/P60 family cysteine hydrolase [Sphingobium sp. B7D2B]MCW2365868.1 hypothetical protein [Sphingobium sp. B7D2B]